MQNTTWSIDVLPQPQPSDVEVQDMVGKQKKDAKKQRAIENPIFNRECIFKRCIFHCHVSLEEGRIFQVTGRACRFK